MPSVLIEVRRQLADGEGLRLIEAVHGALRRAIRIPTDDRICRLVVHEPDRFAVPPTLEQPELFTYVTIDMFEGRSLEAKRSLYAALVENLEALGIPRNHVTILLHEMPLSNWGIRGGQAASDVDLGFEVEV